MTTASSIYRSCIPENLENIFHRTSVTLKKMSEGLSDVNVLILNAKVVEAYNSISETFFSVKMPSANNLSAALKTLKGWNALGTLPSQVFNTSNAVYRFVQEAAFNSFINCATQVSVTINKMYEAASFLEKQIAVPFFQGVTDAYKTTHFGALLTGSVIRTYTNLNLLISGYGSQLTASLKVIESLSTTVFASSILIGGMSNQFTVAVSAAATLAKGAEYIYTKCL